jgi:hypothetical protein
VYELSWYNNGADSKLFYSEEEAHNKGFTIPGRTKNKNENPSKGKKFFNNGIKVKLFCCEEDAAKEGFLFPGTKLASSDEKQ